MGAGGLEALASAAMIVFDPGSLAFIGAGVVIGLCLGVLPGLGGLTGMALLIPFTYGMDPAVAFAFLIGMLAVTATSDTIPAVLIGLPGGAGSQATVLDGPPMTRRGEGTRALSAAFAASLIGGVIGAVLIAAAIPLVRPLVLAFGSPELLALSVLGISMVATLSGTRPLAGLAMGALGALLAMVGSDPQAGELRWTFGSLYLWDGLPLVPIVLGLFAIPELCDYASRKMPLVPPSRQSVADGILAGLRDVMANLWLICRSSLLGAAIGALPGLGSSVVDWLVYGHAMRTEKGADKTFGTGDVRGVIAPESANNAIYGGALLPTLAFGVPGSASMAMLLAAFQVHGLNPGPQLLAGQQDIVYSMIMSLALANVLGAAICFSLSGRITQIAALRLSLVLPAILVILVLGAYQGSRHWGDIFVLLVFSVLGWTMKRAGWSRAPLVLGFVLGALIERYMFISTLRYGADWLLRPIVLLLLACAGLALVGALVRHMRRAGSSFTARGDAQAQSGPGAQVALHLVMLALGVAFLVPALSWPRQAALAPVITASAFLAFVSASLAETLLRWRIGAGRAHVERATAGWPGEPASARGVSRFAGWLLALIAMIAVAGLAPAAMLFVLAFMRLESRERWSIVIPYTIAIGLLVEIVFMGLLATPDFPSLFGHVMRGI